MDQYNHGEIAVRIVAKFHFTDPSKSKASCQKSKSCNKVKRKKCKIKKKINKKGTNSWKFGKVNTIFEVKLSSNDHSWHNLGQQIEEGSEVSVIS